MVSVLLNLASAATDEVGVFLDLVSDMLSIIPAENKTQQYIETGITKQEERNQTHLDKGAGNSSR